VSDTITNNLDKLLNSSLKKGIFSGVSAAVFSYPDRFTFISLGETSFLRESYKIK